MIAVGSLVKLSWWSVYRAPSANKNNEGKTTWHDVKPGDTGIVLSVFNGLHAIVLFSSVDALLKIHLSMIQEV